MKRIILQLFFIILILQVLNFFLAMPDYIPRFKTIIIWISFINYSIVIILFILMVGIMIRDNYRQKSSFINWLRPIGVCLMSVSIIFFGGCFTAFLATDGLFSPRYIKEYKYSKVSATVYVYDSGFMDPEITIKVRNGWLPIERKVITLGISDPDFIVFNDKNDCLYIYSYSDTTIINSKQIMKY